MNGKEEKGSVLVMALWALMFLSFLTIIFGGVARQVIRFSSGIETRKELYDISYSGSVYAIKSYVENKARDLTALTDSLNDWWSNDAYVFGQRSVGRGSFTVEHTHINSLTGEEELWYGLRDESRKININYASPRVLKHVFSHIGGADAKEAQLITFSVIDWRDKDDILYNQEGNPTEKEFYESKAYTYAPPNRHLIELEELLLVHGLGREIYLSVAPYLTVYGSGRVNINTASGEVLLALGISQGLVEKILTLRRGGDLTEGSRDDHVFISERRVLDDLAERYILTDAEKDEMRNVLNQGILTARSTVFKAVSVSELEHTSQQGVSVCVFDKNGEVKYYSFRLQNAGREL